MQPNFYKKTNWKIFVFLVVITMLSIMAFYLSEKKEETKGEAALVGAALPEQEVVAELPDASDEQLKEKIGQMIMIGFRGTEAEEGSDIYNAIKDVKIGGVVLFDYDAPSKSYSRNIKSKEQVKRLISDIQSYSSIPMFVSVDAEGGQVNRLKEKYGFSKIISAEKMGEDKTLNTVRIESEKLVNELGEAGFNMNLAPVVDLNSNPKNPIIGAVDRAFSANPDTVFNNAKIFIKNHLIDNIITVEKHFPGQGSAKTDSHLGMVDITNTYKDEELTPYKKLAQEGLLDAVMTAHVINKKIDKDYPASMSSYFLEDILRKQIGFKGVIISDDMQMGAITKNYSLEDAIIKSINAGSDIVSVLNNSSEGYDEKIAYKVRDVIFNAVKDKKIDEKRIEESYSRIISLKKKFRIITPAPEEIESEKFELLGQANPLSFKQAFDIAKYVSQNAKIRPAFLLAISQEELILEKFDMCYLTDLKTGSGVRAADNKKTSRVMHPERDIPHFLNITKELKKDPLKTLVTCPMSFGWGGAMGPLDFIPSTWVKYKDRLEKITGKPADPWDIRDAFLAAGIYLSESGAGLKTRQGEQYAAMEYFSGATTSSPYTWYANDVIKISNKIQKDIDIIEK